MFRSEKPYSSVTVAIENLTAEAYEEEDFSGIPELVEAIKLQSTGPTEAARAIRKKLKYGNVHRQLRALVILDGLIQNAGSNFQRGFADEPLLERLRVCGSDQLSDPAVKNKCRVLFRSWAQYAGTPGLDRIARLHKELPKRKVAATQERSKVIQETENPFGDEEEEEAAAKAAQKKSVAGGPSNVAAPETHTKSPSGSTSFFGHRDKKKDKSKGKRKTFNLEAEQENMKVAIQDASTSSNGLLASLQTINREHEQISENQAVLERFEECKTLRRRVLRYIHHVENEQLLGALLHSNDELVTALMTFEQLDRSIDADSDSDDELAEQAHLYRMITEKGKEAQAAKSNAPDLSGLNLDSDQPPVAPPRPPPVPKPSQAQPPRPPRPAPPPSYPPAQSKANDDDDEDDDPFGDEHGIDTPGLEREQPRW